MRVLVKSFIFFDNDHLSTFVCKKLYVGVRCEQNEIEGPVRQEKWGEVFI